MAKPTTCSTTSNRRVGVTAPSLWQFLSSSDFLKGVGESAIWGAVFGPFVSALMSGVFKNPAGLWAEWKPVLPKLLYLLPLIGIIWATVITGFTTFHRYYLMPRINPQRSPATNFSLVSVSGFLCGFVSIYVIFYLCLLVLDVSTAPRGDLLSNGVFAGVLGVFIGNMMYLFHLNQVDLLHSAQRQQKLERVQLEGRLMNLNLRIRPHFFFNSMNTLSGLIDRNIDQAHEFLTDLSDLFRQSFGLGHDGATCAWHEERALIESYLNIEQKRFGKKLSWRIDVSADSDASFPAFLLQPLIENAVYHGISKLPQGGEIVISGGQRRSNWMLQIRNPTPENAKIEAKAGHALALSRQRLELLGGRLTTRLQEQNLCLCLSWPVQT